MSAKQPSLPLGIVCTHWVAGILLVAFLITLLGCMRRFVALDCALTAIVLAIVASLRSSRRFVREMPTMHRLAFAFLAALVLFGHGTARGRQTFPFVPWTMFNTCAAGKTIIHFEIEAVTENASRTALNPERLFPSLGVGTTRMASLLTGMAAAAVAERPSKEAVRRYRDMLLAIGRAFNQQTASPAQHLEVVRVQTKFNGIGKRETVYRVDLP